jgi:hypothetical protein
MRVYLAHFRALEIFIHARGGGGGSGGGRRALANGERGRGDRLTTPLTWLKPLAAHMRQNLYFAPNGTTLAPPRLNTTRIGTLLLFITGG